MVALILFALAGLISGSLGQTSTPPNGGGKVSQECLDFFSKAKTNQCMARANLTGIDPNAGFEQVQTTLSNFIESTCSSQCRESGRIRFSEVKKSCTSVSDRMYALGANIGLFGLDVFCSKAGDGIFCQLKMLEILKKNNLKPNDFLNLTTPGSTNATINVEKLPQELVCSDCFKKFEEQSYAFSVSMSKIEGLNDESKTNFDSYKKARQENVAKINGMCGAGFVSENPTLELGSTRSAGSSVGVAGSTLLNAIGGIVVGFGLLNL
ncbi:hypothetical protein BKA69DRAFT_1128062 [Paraphysoderma sedebokerense]|nr:hypothetical protein BKA69DRAFT_1128062 [Paraphysoderma sedebokerense]